MCRRGPSGIILTMDPKRDKASNKILGIFADIKGNYKRGSFDYRKSPNLIIDMLLNNMKIEGQEVNRKDFLELLDEQNAS